MGCGSFVSILFHFRGKFWELEELSKSKIEPRYDKTNKMSLRTASALSDQSLRCPHEERLSPLLPIELTVKTLIRLNGCPGWSESSLGLYSFCWFCHIVAHLSFGNTMNLQSRKTVYSVCSG